MMNETNELTLQEKLDWIRNQNIDPKRSEITGYIPDWVTDDFGPESLIWIERYQTVYYDEFAESIAENIEYTDNLHVDDKLKDINYYKDMINGIYEDMHHNIYGFIFDW